MNQEKSLYPLRFSPLIDVYPWGEEEFALADLGYRDTPVVGGWLGGNGFDDIMETYMDRLVGESVYDYTGRQFPVCVRVLHVNGKLPFQVHPDDTLASQRYDFLGKEKLWYVLEAGPGSLIYTGFKQDCNASDFIAACGDGSLETLLNGRTARKGQMIHIAPGTPHGACGKLTILEIAESSPLDFCLSETPQGQFESSLNPIEALDFIDFTAWKEDSAQIEQFRFDVVELSRPLDIDLPENDTFILYYCLRGKALLQSVGQGYEIKKRELLLLPAELDSYTLTPLEEGTLLARVMMRENKPLDSYLLNPKNQNGNS